MADKATKITRVEIEGLWGRYDLVWNLRPDVNILAGVNGSGKSTILNCVADFVKTGKPTFYYPKSINKLSIVFDNEQTISIEGDSRQIGIPSSWHQLRIVAKVDLICTFDSVNDIKVNTREGILTELDWFLSTLQKSYLDYQLNLGKRMIDILKQTNGNSEEYAIQVSRSKDRFVEILDGLFSTSGKRIDQNKNEVSFLNGAIELSPYKLSAGEKQLLVILMTVLIQDNKPSILLLDEPEISLHIDWQKKLIGYIRELNPNCQVILATHSPAIIMEGWADCVFEVRDLITLDRNAVPQ